MRISIGSDHAGFEQKEKLAAHLVSCGHEVHDLGPFSEDRVDYPDYARLVCESIQNDDAERGVLVCGTGIGMAIAANKMRGIRAANVTSPEFAALAREHNDCNVITVSGRFVALEENEKIVDTFLATEFAGGRHAGRIEKMMALEEVL